MEEPKVPARPRARKAAKEAVAAPAPAEVAEAPAVKARKPRTPRAKVAKVAKLEEPEAPVAELETAVVAPADPAPSPAPAPAVQAAAADSADLVTDQARAVLLAIQEGRAVELLFVDAENNPPRTFEPRQLIFDTFARGWYVWGWDRRYNAERHHLLSLIAQVNPVEGMGRAAQGPYKEGTPANLIGGWLGGEAIRVRAVLLKQWIFAVRQAPAPFPEFLIEDMEEGKAQVSFTATDLRAITRWVMQFGDGIQILEPQRLLDRIKQVGLAWGGKPAAAALPPPSAKAPRSEHRSEHKEHRSEHRFEGRPEAAERPERSERPERPERPERKAPEQPRFQRESRESHDAPKAKAGKIEIRIDRL